MCASTTVLIVDDDETFRRNAARLLTGHGYSCVEAANSAEARAVLETEPDVAAVVCDSKLSGPSGTQLIIELTADYPDTAVVVTTAIDAPGVADAMLGFGAFGYLVKPFDANELLISLAGAVKRRDLEAAQRDQLRALEQTIARTKILGGVLDGLDGDVARPLKRDEEMSERLSRAVSLRDEETGRHIERMSRYSVVLAEAVGFTAMSLEDLRLATALHDVGKIGVPDGILLKPGSLSGDEYAAMQRHAQIGYQLLAGSQSELVHRAAEIALTHHEWWDGTGYPRGLHGEEIPEEGRIAAVTDVFDALTSNRVYRAGSSFGDALTTMQALRGRQFEPRLLDAFFNSIEKIAAIRDAYPDLEDDQQRVRILVVDDHQIFAHSLVRLLESRPELKIVGTAGSVDQAIAAAAAYAPDVILMDFELPDGDGAQATEQIKALTPAVRVIMLTAHTDEQSLVRAIAAGCSGFVKKEDAVDVLFEAIVAAHHGETITPHTDLTPLLRQLRPTHRGLGTDLTSRELEILGLIGTGLANKQIAQQLGLRLNTVRNHAQNILYKLQAHSKLEAVATAVRERIISYPNEAANQ